MAMELSRRLVRALLDEGQSIPERIARKTKLHILDNFAVMTAATRSPLSTPVLEAMMCGGASGTATIIGRSERVPPAIAAFSNASLAHIMGYDDIHDIARIHPTSVTPTGSLSRW